ncbi:MAG TPA: SRPBCC family protein [Verrucomicrobiae bacterium]|nr:SRPBCC family protein [Verrucomicrobiae bacterium]
MARIEKDIEVNAPLRSVYDQWTQFEEFPRFMDGVREVRQLDDTHLHWCAKVAGKELEWDAEILEQVPDQRIAWRSITGKLNAGTVEFQSVDAERTKVCLTMEYDPEGPIENVGDALGVTARRVGKDLENFKDFIEQHAGATGQWRGEVHGGRTTTPDRNH